MPANARITPKFFVDAEFKIRFIPAKANNVAVINTMILFFNFI